MSGTPTVEIFQPTEGSFVIQGNEVVGPGIVATMVTFTANAVDPEDGLLDDSAMAWRVTTSIQTDVFVGSGRSISGRVLTPIADCFSTQPAEATLTAIDSDGNVSVQTVHFVLGPICPLFTEASE